MSVATLPRHAAPTRGLRAFLSAALLSFQEARMKTVLHSLSDERLEAIGVSRAGIDAYASELVRGENA